MNRRTFLSGMVFASVVPAVGGIASRTRTMRDRRWNPAQSPTSRTLRAVTHTATGPFAAGSNGIVLERGDAGWQMVRENGPGGNGSNLTALDSTSDGGRLWMAGASGALGEYDVRSGELTDRTAPDGLTNNLTALAVMGESGDADVFVGDASGAVYVSTANGRSGSWTSHMPGTTIAGIECYEATTAVLVDGNGTVFRTTDGDSWSQVAADGATGAPNAVAGTESSDITVVGTQVHVRTDDGWRSQSPTDATLYGVDVCSCGCIHAVGGSGTILHSPGRRMGSSDSGDQWRTVAPTGENLHGIVAGRPHVAVGASGTVLER